MCRLYYFFVILMHGLPQIPELNAYFIKISSHEVIDWEEGGWSDIMGNPKPLKTPRPQLDVPSEVFYVASAPASHRFSQRHRASLFKILEYFVSVLKGSDVHRFIYFIYVFITFRRPVYHL